MPDNAQMQNETQEPIRPNATRKLQRNILICPPRNVIHGGVDENTCKEPYTLTPTLILLPNK